MRVSVVADESASSRTRNRIREHGTVFEVMKWSVPCSALGGRLATLFRADDGWEGWLPIQEIETHGI